MNVDDRKLRKYKKLLSKHIYRWSRLSSHQHSCLGNKLLKIRESHKRFDEFGIDFNNGYFPNTDDTIFYKTYNKLFNKFVNKKFIENNDEKQAKLNQEEQIQETEESANQQKILVMLDYDDTLIPSTIIEQKKFFINDYNTTPSERVELENYCSALNKFMDKLFYIFDNNKDRNIKIVTNASSSWVIEGSFCRTGPLFAKIMRPFNEKMAKAKVNIISSCDSCKQNKNIFNNLKIKEYKKYLMKWIYDDYFGMKLINLNQDIKIISIGDSFMEFKASKMAFKYYLQQQSENILNNINVSLHRIKFIKRPESFQKLGDELTWCTQNIHDIIYKNHKSKDYYL